LLGLGATTPPFSGVGDMGGGLGGCLVDVFDTPTQNGGGLGANGKTAGADENYRK